MKMPLIFKLMLLLICIFFLPNGFAQYQTYTQFSLPEGVKARIGKGSITGQLAFSPDGTRFAVGCTIGIWIYNARTGEEINLLTHPYADAVSFSPDGRTLASGSDDATIRLWDVKTGTHLKTLTGHKRSVYSVAFSPDGRTLASGSKDASIRLWDAKTGTHLKTLTGHTVWVNTVAFSPDGRTLASGSDDATIRLWDAKTGTHLQTCTGHTNLVYSVAFSPDGRTLASGSKDASIRLWDAKTGTHLKTLTGHTVWVNTVAFSPDGRTLASGSDDATIRLWDAKTGTHLKTLTGHPREVRSVAFSPDSLTLVSSGTVVDSALNLWDVATGEHKKTITGYMQYVYSIAFSPDGGILATGTWDGTVYLWDAVTGTQLHTLKGHTTRVINMAFSPDGSLLATVGKWQWWDDKPGSILLWAVATGKQTHTLAEGYVGFDVSFSPNGIILAGMHDDDIHLWDAVTGEVKNTFSTRARGPLQGLAFSPDGSTLAGCYDGSVSWWDAVTGEVKGERSHSLVQAITFSPNGRFLASGGDDSFTAIHLWDNDTYEHLKGFDDYYSSDNLQYLGEVHSLSFSPNSRTFASGSSDGIVRLWEVPKELQPTSTFTGHVGERLYLSPNHAPKQSPTARLIGHNRWTDVHSVMFSPDGSILASAGEDGIVLLWDVASLTDSAVDSPQVAGDANGDGVVNILDLVLVSSRFGQSGETEADVNGDGVVNIQDLVLVAGAIGEAAGAPLIYSTSLEILTAADVRQWLTAAEVLGLTDARSQRGIAVLERLLAVLMPKETVLLPNYPNSFNPETWIPYHLAEPADVTLHIYSAEGRLVRTLALGHQAAGIYESKSRAAYWDGRNSVGERVASGLYFYTLTAGDFADTGKMLIMK